MLGRRERSGSDTPERGSCEEQGAGLRAGAGAAAQGRPGLIWEALPWEPLLWAEGGDCSRCADPGAVQGLQGRVAGRGARVGAGLTVPPRDETGPSGGGETGETGHSAGAGCGEHRAAPTCLAAVAEDALRADAQVGPAGLLAPAAVPAGAGGAGVHLCGTSREWARAAGGSLGEGGEDSGQKGRGGEGRGPWGARGSGKPPHLWGPSRQRPCRAGPWGLGCTLSPSSLRYRERAVWGVTVRGPPAQRLPVSQWAPAKPAGHWQTKAPGRSLQEPPFLQGCAWHSSVSADTGHEAARPTQPYTARTALPGLVPPTPRLPCAAWGLSLTPAPIPAPRSPRPRILHPALHCPGFWGP